VILFHKNFHKLLQNLAVEQVGEEFMRHHLYVSISKVTKDYLLLAANKRGEEIDTSQKKVKAGVGSPKQRKPKPSMNNMFISLYHSHLMEENCADTYKTMEGTFIKMSNFSMYRRFFNFLVSE